MRNALLVRVTNSVFVWSQRGFAWVIDTSDAIPDWKPLDPAGGIGGLVMPAASHVTFIEQFGLPTPPKHCEGCHNPILKYLDEGSIRDWRPCEHCGGLFCEECCELARVTGKKPHDVLALGAEAWADIGKKLDAQLASVLNKGNPS